MYVNLWFDEEGEGATQHYLLKRKVVPLSDKPRNPSQIRVDFEVSINGRLSHSPKEAVEAILPVAANQFFMFHGEDLRKMSQRHVEHTQRAIELIIDAETFLQGKRDLAHVGDEIEKELDAERAKFGVMDQHLQTKKEIQTTITTLKGNIGEVKGEVDTFQKEFEEVEQKLTHYSESQKLMAQLEEKKRQLNRLEEEKQRILERRSSLVNELSLQLLLPELKKALSKKEERHKEIEEKRRYVSGMRSRKEFIESLLKEDMCVCERPLEKRERERLQAKAVSLSKLIGEREAKIEKEDPTYYDLRETIAGIERTHLDVEAFYRDVSKNALEIDETKTAREKLDAALGEINQEEVRELNDRRDELKGDIRY